MVLLWVRLGTALISVAATAFVTYLTYRNSNRNNERCTEHHNTTSNRIVVPSNFCERKRLCGICSKKINVTEGTGSLGVYELRCGHEFHKDCLKAVFSEELKGKRTCPYRYCRASIPERFVSQFILS